MRVMDDVTRRAAGRAGLTRPYDYFDAVPNYTDTVPDYRRLAREIGQRNFCAARILERERRRFLAFLDRHVVPPWRRIS